MSKQHRYFEAHRQGGFSVPVPSARDKSICLPSRDKGALSNTSFTAAAYSLHNDLSPVFVLDQPAPTLICNFQCLVRTPQSSLHASPLPCQNIASSLFPAWGQGTLLKNLPSHIHTLQRIPRKLHLPKREIRPTPKKHLNSERLTQVSSYPFLW